MRPAQSFSVPLSHALVAFTIEFDNQAERRIPHWTTMSGKPHGVWLTSMVMWWNCMQFVGDEPIGVKELARRARTGTNLDGMHRWGYLTVSPAPPKFIRATPNGLKAREIWAPLAAEIEKRWRERFGAAEVDHFRAGLYAIAGQRKPILTACEKRMQLNQAVMPGLRLQRCGVPMHAQSRLYPYCLKTDAHSLLIRSRHMPDG
jgi:hypothetical protein